METRVGKYAADCLPQETGGPLGVHWSERGYFAKAREGPGRRASGHGVPWGGQRQLYPLGQRADSHRGGLLNFFKVQH